MLLSRVSFSSVDFVICCVLVWVFILLSLNMLSVVLFSEMSVSVMRVGDMVWSNMMFSLLV